MGLEQLARQAVHAATAAPRLYSAALRSGASPRGAVEVLQISEAALRVSADRAAGVPGRRNAVRHFLWQAVLTARLGRETATAVALSQESGTTRHADSLVDHHNNAVGQAYGAAHAEQLRAVSIAEAVEGLVPVALEKWDAGELVWVTRR
jgi:hypothetical protein